MILDICRRIIELNPQWGVAQNVDILKLASGVVLIDEIELHLHPKWQQQVLNDLIEIFPQIQFIVTTHSPSIINSVEKKQLLLLVDNSVYYPEGTYGKDVNSILENIMGVPSRPEQIENEIRYIYQLIDDSKYEDATLAFEKLRHIIGHDDSEIISLGITIDLESPEEE
jgi:predicted ATP-binding protein involved in virulence